MVTEDLANVLTFALEKHRGQFRKRVLGGTKMPYFSHCMDVYKMQWRWGCGTVVNNCAALCHDILEDTDCLYDTLVAVIGAEAAAVVKELTFLPTLQDEADMAKQKIEYPTLNIKKALKEKYMASFNTKTVNALVIKLADRYCNVLDYALTDFSYSGTYFHQADSLFECMVQRQAEIEREYGEAAWKAINDTHYHVCEVINGYRRV